MFKKIAFVMLFVIMVLTPVMAQVAADPNDAFYEDALRWELQGLISKLPEMRPYSLQLVKSILETVMASEDEIAAEEAKEYYEKYFGKFLRFGAETSVYTEIKDGKLEKQLDINPLIYGNAEVLPNTTISFEATPMLSTVLPREGLIPKYTAPKYDGVADGADVGKFNIYSPFNAVVGYGAKDIYFQFGLNRNSFGNILDKGIVIGSTAPHVGSFVFTINKERVNYHLAMLMLTASTSMGSGIYPSKYFYLHSIGLNITDKLQFTFYETATTGPQFNFSYLLPIVPFMAVQHIYGCNNDNLLMGGQLSYRPVKGLSLFINGYADDLHFNDLVRFQFDTRLKFALETGIQYAPSSASLCKFALLDYTMITPYTYSHSMFDGNHKLDLTGPNYQNHTTRGVSLGSMIEPNSDSLRLLLRLSPMDKLQIEINSSIVRHGNINETLYKKAVFDKSVENTDAFNSVKQYLIYGGMTNGSIFDIPYATSDYLPYPLRHFMFLDETTNYVCLQNSMEAKYTYVLKNKSYLEFGLNYTLQYERNVGIDNNIFSKVDDVTANTPTSEIITLLDNQYSEWKSKLHDKLSNFLSISVKFVY